MCVFLHYMGRNLGPGKIFTARVKRSPRQDFDIGQYHDIMSSSALSYYCHWPSVPVSYEVLRMDR